jgi:MFS family permease
VGSLPGEDDGAAGRTGPGAHGIVAGAPDAPGTAAPGGGGEPLAGGRLGLALLLVSTAQFVLQLDFSIVNVALATIQRELGLQAADLQWIVTGYALTFGSLLLLGGRLGDFTGHRRLLTAGLVLFAAASLLAGLAVTPGMLIGARLAQGGCAAMVAPMTLAAVTDLFPDGPGRTRALGIYQGATAAGASTGIVLGGILTTYAGWRWIFLVNPPVIAVLVAAMSRLLPPARPAASPATAGRNRAASPETGTSGHVRPGAGARARLDVAGAVLATVSVAALIYGLSTGQQHGFASPGALVAAVVLAAAFAVAERRASAPMVPLAILASRDRRVALTVTFTVSTVIVAYVYFVSLYMQRVLHFSALRTGLGLLPATVTVLVTSTWLTRRLLARFGMKAVLAAGLTSIGLGQAWLTQVTPHGSYPVNVLPGLVLTAFGMGLMFPAASVAATAGVAPGDRGLAGGLFAAAQQVGLAVGLAVLATVAAARTRSAAAAAHASPAAALVGGYRLSYLVGAITVACALAATLIALRTRAPDDRVSLHPENDY